MNLPDHQTNGRARIPSGTSAAAFVLALAFATAANAQEDPGVQDAVAPSVESAPAPVITLEEVLERAAAVSPLVDIERAELEVAAVRRLEARWLRFPRFRVDSTISPAPRVELEIDPETGELDPFSNRDTDAELLESIIGGAGLSFRNQVTAVLPLTTFGKIRLARQLGDVGIDAAELELATSIRESQFSAYQAYATVQWYREVDALLSEAEERLDQAAEELEWNIDEGDRTARTSLRQLTIARTDFVDLRGQADALGRLARFALMQTYGFERDFRVTRLDETMPDENDSEGTAAESAVPELDEVLVFARDHRPDYQLLDAAAHAADLARLLRWRALTPDIYFGASLSHAWSPTVDDVSGAFINDPYNRFGVGFLVGLRWNMNPAATAVRARRAEAMQVTVEAQREAAWLGIELEVTEAYFEATAKRELLLAFDDALRAATAWLRQAQLQYDQGLADFEDLKDPLEEYYRTAGGYYEAILRYRLAVANLALKTGSDDLLDWPLGE